ncbi:MAG: peptidyl-prolyl cis-trans isomerase [Pirellulales bacterium]|nr:peptidyl-prolyl cis-trans isomerase [Pirellulales bacterium]
MPPRINFLVLVLLPLLLPIVAWGQPPVSPPEAATVELPEDPAAVIAVVGQTPILLGDLIGRVEARIQEVVSQNPGAVPPEALPGARVNLVRRFLAEAIQNKRLRECFLLDQVGTAAADQRAEASATLATRARQMFFESEVPQLKKRYQVDDLAELDQILRQQGTSLAGRQRDFADAILGHLYVSGKVDKNPAVSIAEISNHYHENLDQFHHPPRARWEQLTVLFSNFPTRKAAHDAIWEMGREAYFGGNMQAVAKQKSQEPLAKSKGGLHEWTAQGALASEPLNQQIFSIELNAMSDIIEDEQGFHIIRVLDRQPAGHEPLSDVQEKIRKKIKAEKVSKARRELMEDVQKRVPIWTLFPKDVPGAKPLPQTASRPGVNLQ